MLNSKYHFGLRTAFGKLGYYNIYIHVMNYLLYMCLRFCIVIVCVSCFIYVRYIAIHYLQDDRTPLYTAIKGGHILLTELLLSRGAGVNERDKVSMLNS